MESQAGMESENQNKEYLDMWEMMLTLIFEVTDALPVFSISAEECINVVKEADEGHKTDHTIKISEEQNESHKCQIEEVPKASDTTNANCSYERHETSAIGKEADQNNKEISEKVGGEENPGAFSRKENEEANSDLTNTNYLTNNSKLGDIGEERTKTYDRISCTNMVNEAGNETVQCSIKDVTSQSSQHIDAKGYTEMQHNDEDKPENNERICSEGEEETENISRPAHYLQEDNIGLNAEGHEREKDMLLSALDLSPAAKQIDSKQIHSTCSDKKKDVHFNSPVAVVHEYITSQNESELSTQSLSESYLQEIPSSQMMLAERLDNQNNLNSSDSNSELVHLLAVYDSQFQRGRSDFHLITAGGDCFYSVMLQQLNHENEGLRSGLEVVNEMGDMVCSEEHTESNENELEDEMSQSSSEMKQISDSKYDCGFSGSDSLLLLENTENTYDVVINKNLSFDNNTSEVQKPCHEARLFEDKEVPFCNKSVPAEFNEVFPKISLAQCEDQDGLINCSQDLFETTNTTQELDLETKDELLTGETYSKINNNVKNSGFYEIASALEVSQTLPDENMIISKNACNEDPDVTAEEVEQKVIDKDDGKDSETVEEKLVEDVQVNTEDTDKESSNDVRSNKRELNSPLLNNSQYMKKHKLDAGEIKCSQERKRKMLSPKLKSGGVKLRRLKLCMNLEESNTNVEQPPKIVKHLPKMLKQLASDRLICMDDNIIWEAETDNKMMAESSECEKEKKSDISTNEHRTVDDNEKMVLCTENSVETAKSERCSVTDNVEEYVHINVDSSDLNYNLADQTTDEIVVPLADNSCNIFNNCCEAVVAEGKSDGNKLTNVNELTADVPELRSDGHELTNIHEFTAEVPEVKPDVHAFTAEVPEIRSDGQELTNGHELTDGNELTAEVPEVKSGGHELTAEVPELRTYGHELTNSHELTEVPEVKSDGHELTAEVPELRSYGHELTDGHELTAEVPEVKSDGRELTAEVPEVESDDHELTAEVDGDTAAYIETLKMKTSNKLTIISDNKTYNSSQENSPGFITANELLSQNSEANGSTGFTMNDNEQTENLSDISDSCEIEFPFVPDLKNDNEDGQFVKICNQFLVADIQKTDKEKETGVPELKASNNKRRFIEITQDGINEEIVEYTVPDESAEHVSKVAEECHEQQGQPVAIDQDEQIDADQLEDYIGKVVDQLVPDDTSDSTAESDTGESLYNTDEEKKAKVYACDADICDDDDGPVCSPVISMAGKTHHYEKCFKWKYTPSCDFDSEDPVQDLPDEDTVVKIAPLKTCGKPLRLGLSKRQPMKNSLHKQFQRK